MGAVVRCGCPFAATSRRNTPSRHARCSFAVTIPPPAPEWTSTPSPIPHRPGDRASIYTPSPIMPSHAFKSNPQHATVAAGGGNTRAGRSLAAKRRLAAEGAMRRNRGVDDPDRLASHGALPGIAENVALSFRIVARLAAGLWPRIAQVHAFAWIWYRHGVHKTWSNNQTIPVLGPMPKA